MNIETRNKIYKRAKELFCKTESRATSGYIYFGMCPAIKDAAIEYGMRAEIGYTKMIDMLPELKELRPINAGGGYWWNQFDRKTRLGKFNLIIKQTEV